MTPAPDTQCALRKPADGEAGFTLVEALVSLALLALAAVFIAQGLAVNRTMLERIDGKLTASDQLTAAHDVIRTALERLSPQTTNDGLVSFVDMDGSSEAISFAAPFPSPGAGAQLQRLHLYRSSAGVLRLDMSGRGSSAALLQRVRSLQIAYWSGDAGGGGMWRSRWYREPMPPQIIRIRIEFEDADRVSPELIVRPGATVSSDCVFDQEEGACRGRVRD